MQTWIIIDSYSLQRDARYYRNPDVFYPERWLEGQDEGVTNQYLHLAFGAGRRSCFGIFLLYIHAPRSGRADFNECFTGQHFAMMEMKVLLFQVLQVICAFQNLFVVLCVFI